MFQVSWESKTLNCVQNFKSAAAASEKVDDLRRKNRKNIKITLGDRTWK